MAVQCHQLKQDRQCTYNNITLWYVCLTIVASKSNHTFPFYCCWHRCCCEQWRSVHCFHGNATM